ncbi:hypothetical protein FRB97_003856 [Tulasnella sp. 331]|nr:hypothetical protein FRB97_003856 [Tulasnella sp. 331]
MSASVHSIPHFTTLKAAASLNVEPSRSHRWLLYPLMRIIQVDDHRTIHIFKSQEEVEEVKLKRSESGLGDVDWHLHGSTGHIESLQESVQHHTRKREDLRTQHPEIFAELDNVQREIDHLSKELGKHTSRPVELEANFSRFGYAAHIRTHKSRVESDDERDDTHKAEKKGDETTVNDALPIEDVCMIPGKRRKKHRVTMKVYKKPVLRQYLHQGVIWRAEHSEEVASFELFIDLLYVGIIALIGDKATENPTGTGLLDFCNITFGFWSTYSQLISFYIAAQVFFAIFYLRMAYFIPHARPFMLSTAFQFSVSIGLWVGSCFIKPQDGRLGIIWVAIAWDTFAGTKLPINFGLRESMQRTFMTRLSILPKVFKIQNLYEYIPAINIEHKTERIGAFVTLVYGYSVVALLYQNQATFGLNAFFGKAALGLIQAFCFNWIYFDVDASHLRMHAIRRHASSASIWLTVHLPFVMSFTLSAAALSKLVVAHDCGDASIDALTDVYQAKSIGDIPNGMRWYYCGGLAVALLSMATISVCHVHAPIDGQRLRKRTRLSFRVVIAIVLLCLPLAKSLNSLHLIGTTTALMILALTVDVWGQSAWEDTFWDGQECRYRAKQLAISGTSSGASSEQYLYSSWG